MVKSTTKRPVRRAAPRPQLNESRAAGQPVAASAAATEPTSFYDTGDTQGASNYDPDPAEPQPRAVHQTVFAERVRQHASQLETGGSADREVVEGLAAEAITDPNDLAAEIERIRKIRKPIGAYSQKLALPKRSGYHRHWFNDVAGRVAEAELNGWTHIKGTDGKPISRCVGSGRDKGALYAFAMELPELFWQEDQDARNQAAADKMQGLKSAPFRSAPGQAKPADKGKFYDPTESEEGPIQIGSSLVKG